MTQYIFRAFTVWLIGFSPAFEIYLAVPAGIALGLDYCSTVVWSVIGNYMPILLIHYCYKSLNRIQRVENWLKRLESKRLKHWIDIYGIGFVLLITPWIGTWAMAVTMKLLRMNSRLFMIYSFISVVLYAIALATLIYLGVGLNKN